MSNNIVYQPSITTHWKNLFEKKSMLLGSHNLNPGEELILQIQGVSVQEIKGDKGKSERVPVLQFNNANPMVLNVTNAKTIAQLYGELHEHWIGKHIQLFSAEIKVAGQKMTALRVRTFKPQVDVDTSQYEAILRGCKSLQQLQQAWMKQIPKELRTKLEGIKDEMKGALNV